MGQTPIRSFRKGKNQPNNGNTLYNKSYMPKKNVMSENFQEEWLHKNLKRKPYKNKGGE